MTTSSNRSRLLRTLLTNAIKLFTTFSSRVSRRLNRILASSAYALPLSALTLFVRTASAPNLANLLSAYASLRRALRLISALRVRRSLR
jgi:hypothetical protein